MAKSVAKKYKADLEAVAKELQEALKTFAPLQKEYTRLKDRWIQLQEEHVSMLKKFPAFDVNGKKFSGGMEGYQQVLDDRSLNHQNTPSNILEEMTKIGRFSREVAKAKEETAYAAQPMDRAMKEIRSIEERRAVAEKRLNDYIEQKQRLKNLGREGQAEYKQWKKMLRKELFPKK
jgi:predicted  nucleic acid-binding Zn-ribbon protein